MTTELKDLTNDFRMPADTFAAILAVNGKYIVAWGDAYGAIMDGRGWERDWGTPEHGAEWFESEEEAERYAAEVRECHKSVGA